MRATTGALLLVGTTAVLSAACPKVSPFACDDDEQCDRDGQQGTCVSGDCAYDDDECPGSGLRFSPNAREMAGECVPPMNADTGSTSGGPASSDGVTSVESSTGGASCGTQRVIALDAGLLGATSLPGYPALVVIEDDAALSGESAADAADVFFTDVDGVVLPHEIDAFDPATGTLAAWVRLPGWEAGMPLEIVLRAGDLASAPEPTPTAVWADNYAAVWHMDDELGDARGEVIRDSTSAATHGFALGDMGADQRVDGVIGRALVFDGVDDQMDVDAPFTGMLESFTVSFWVRIDGDDTAHQPFFQSLNGTLYPRCRRLFAESGGNVFCQVGLTDETAGVGAEDTEFPDGETRHFALSWDADAGELRLFASGQEVDAYTTTPGVPLAGDSRFGIGRIEEFGTLNGMLDEFRVSLRALEPEWIAADFRNQGTPSNLILDVGAPEPAPCG